MLSEPFLAFFQRHYLPLQQCEPYLLAVSGGRDSMVLAHLFLEHKIPFEIAHCNFQLRGAESDGDSEFVSNWAKKHQINCHIEQFQTKVFAHENGISTQMAARKLRYSYFDRLRQIFPLGQLCTAHHASDVIETALYQFARGSGLAGMSSIPEINGHIIRPLLALTSKQIAHYAHEHQITWREDSSNATSDYARNFVRHHIVPQFEVMNPVFDQTAMQSVQNLKKTRNNYEWFLTKHLQQALITEANGQVRLPVMACAILPDPSELLRHWLKPYGFDTEQVQQIAQNLKKIGWSIKSGQNTVSVNRGELSLQTTEIPDLPDIIITKQDIMIRLGNGTSLFRTSGNHITELKTTPDTLLVQTDALKWPLRVRTWREGDTFQPFGMQGQTQKVQDYLVHKKVAITDKKQVRILENADGQIIWIVGMRSDHRFRVQNLEADLVKFTVA
jgi:tRNA(Ile)-lysidine synthase